MVVRIKSQHRVPRYRHHVDQHQIPKLCHHEIFMAKHPLCQALYRHGVVQCYALDPSASDRSMSHRESRDNDLHLIHYPPTATDMLQRAHRLRGWSGKCLPAGGLRGGVHAGCMGLQTWKSSQSEASSDTRTALLAC